MLNRSNTKSYSKIYIGIDVHLKTYVIAVVCDGVKIQSFTTKASPKGLALALIKQYPGVEIFSVYEAGFSGFGLHRILLEHGIKNIVVNPASIPVESRNRVKTDKIDALKLAMTLSKGLLRGIRVPSEGEERRRELTRTRNNSLKIESELEIASR